MVPAINGDGASDGRVGTRVRRRMLNRIHAALPVGLGH